MVRRQTARRMRVIVVTSAAVLVGVMLGKDKPLDAMGSVIKAVTFAMTFDSKTQQLTGWLDGQSGDRWLDNPQKDKLLSFAANIAVGFLSAVVDNIPVSLIVERVSGQSMDAFLQARVFKPLGMTSTRYVVADGDAVVCVPRDEAPQVIEAAHAKMRREDEAAEKVRAGAISFT